MATEKSASPVTQPAKAILHGNRTGQIELEYPVEIDGEITRTIKIARLSAEQFASIRETIIAGGEPDLKVMLDAPAAVLEALDQDDADRINEAITSFLPRALRAASAQTSAPTTPTSPSPQASSEEVPSNTSG